MTTDKNRPAGPEEPIQIIAAPKKPSVWRGLRNNFFAGVVVAAPIAITSYLIVTFVGWVDRRVLPLVPEQFNPETYLPFSVPGLGVLIAFIVLTILGAAARNLFGRALLRVGEGLVDRMPLVRNLYKALKQIFETVLAQSETSFQDVALVEYPRKGVYAIAFVTTKTKGEIQERTHEETVSVFVPTTPNPTSGFLLFVPRNELTVLDMTVEEAAKIVISAGLVTPQKLPPETAEQNKRKGLRALLGLGQPDRKSRKASSRSNK